MAILEGPCQGWSVLLHECHESIWRELKALLGLPCLLLQSLSLLLLLMLLHLLLVLAAQGIQGRLL